MFSKPSRSDFRQDCVPTFGLSGRTFRPIRGRRHRVQARHDAVHAGDTRRREKAEQGPGRLPARQQVRRPQVHPQRRELRRGLRHLLRDGIEQREDVREDGGGDGEATGRWMD